VAATVGKGVKVRVAVPVPVGMDVREGLEVADRVNVEVVEEMNVGVKDGVILEVAV
jgi:hypothetical protein